MQEYQTTIRTAKLEDAQRLAEFNRNMALETENLNLPPQVILDGVKAVLENPTRGFYVVAESAQTVMAALMVTTEWSDWRNGELWWIQSVYVVREWRRRGVYRALYQHVKHLAQQDSTVRGLRLYVERNNHVAQKTYTALGMVETKYKVFEHLHLPIDSLVSRET